MAATRDDGTAFDARVLLRDRLDGDNMFGFHDVDESGTPFAEISVRDALDSKQEWSLTLSNEVLELIVDPKVNLLVTGPHPRDGKQLVQFWYEICSPVEGESYLIGDVRVSNFVLPNYFIGTTRGVKIDFLNPPRREPLKPFGMVPGGYVGFFNPRSGEHETYAP
jgi:hypothetical protein